MENVLQNETVWTKARSDEQVVAVKEDEVKAAFDESMSEGSLLERSIISLTLGHPAIRQPIEQLVGITRGIGEQADIKNAVRLIGDRAASCAPSEGPRCLTAMFLEEGTSLMSMVKRYFITAAASLRRLGRNEIQRAWEYLQQRPVEQIRKFLDAGPCNLPANESLLRGGKQNIMNWLYCNNAAMIGMEMEIVPFKNPALWISPFWEESGAYYLYVYLEWKIGHKTDVTGVALMVCINYGFLLGGSLDLTVKVWLRFKDKTKTQTTDEIIRDQSVARGGTRIGGIQLNAVLAIDSNQLRVPWYTGSKHNFEIYYYVITKSLKDLGQPVQRLKWRLTRRAKNQSKAVPYNFYIEFPPYVYNWKQLGQTNRWQPEIALGAMWSL